jgi:competence protein ComFA
MMRFAIIQGKLLPKVLLSSAADTFPISQIEIPPQPAINDRFLFNKTLQSMLAGKQLLLEDLPFPIQEIQSHYENGFLIFRKGIVIENNKPQCVRCGNQEGHLFSSYPCARCGESCVYCRKCIMMGRVSACSPLVSWTGPEPTSGGKVEAETKDDSNQQQKREIEQILSTIRGDMDSDEDDVKVQHSSLSLTESINLPTKNSTQPDSLLDWNGSLSSGQQHASDRVVAATRGSESLLVWAVCGAGKTEVLFQGINAALLEGKRVCIATPRTDVVLELAPRLQRVFPSIQVAVLYGGSKDRHLYAPLTIATTHQLLRFYHAFDTIVVDEVDAFPFSAEETLQYAVEQSRKPTSAMIF